MVARLLMRVVYHTRPAAVDCLYSRAFQGYKPQPLFVRVIERERSTVIGHYAPQRLTYRTKQFALGQLGDDRVVDLQQGWGTLSRPPHLPAENIDFMVGLHVLDRQRNLAGHLAQEISFGLQAGDAISADALAFHNEWNPYHRAKAFREKHIFRGELTLDLQIAPP